MSRKQLAALAIVIGTTTLSAACADERDTADAPPAAELQPGGAQPTDDLAGETVIEGEFEEPEGAAADVDGDYELRTGATGDATLMVELEGLAPGEHAWHIHEAACGTDGPVAIALTPAPGAEAVPGAQALVASSDGKATATVMIPQAELGKLHDGTAAAPSAANQVTPPNSENAAVDRPVTADADTGAAGGAGGFSIHVHARSGADHGPTVACANLDVGRLHSAQRGTATGTTPRY